MVSIQSIMVPVDFSERSTVAAEFAVSLAEEYNAKLYVLHVNEPVHAYAYVYDYFPGDFQQNMINRLTEELSNVIPRDIKERLDVEEILEEGGPAHHIIVEKAKELGIDVIVIATHGRTGLAHVLLGSVAENVVRHAPCPVFVIRTPNGQRASGWK
jgi:nucleotide-binding universal stress UspA family protein